MILTAGQEISMMSAEITHVVTYEDISMLSAPPELPFIIGTQEAALVGRQDLKAARA